MSSRPSECRGRYRRDAALAAAVVLLMPYAAIGQDSTEDGYVYESPVPRFAIVISEAGYKDENHRKALRNTVNDGQRMGELLSRSGFRPRVMIDPTKQQIFDEIDQLLSVEVRHENNQGRKPTVAIYFSGHGFAQAGNDYITTTEFSGSNPIGTSIPLTTLIDRLAGATNLILFTDACRTEIQPGKPTPSDGSVEAPLDAQDSDDDIPPPTGAPTYFKAFAVEPKGIAANFVATPDRNSPYVRAIEMHVFEPGADLQDALVDVRATVATLTRNAQMPITEQGGAARSRYFMIATADDIRRSGEDLRKALRTGDPAQVAKFVERNGSSPYVNGAEKWLADRKKTPTP